MITNGMKTIEVLTEKEVPAIKKFFKAEVDKFLEISHFSVIMITPCKEAYIVSSSREFSENYAKNSFHQYDNTMSPIMYENLDFYTWAEGYIKVNQADIAKIKKSHNLNNGTVFVRKVEGYTLLYCVATKKTDPIMKTIFVNHANSILKMGDDCFNEMAGNFEEASGGILLPKIKKFKPFLERDIPCLSDYEENRKKDAVRKITADKHKLRLIVNNS